MAVLVDRFRMHELFNYPLLLCTLLVSEQMENLEACTSYRLQRNNTLFLSVYFKPAFIHFALVINMLALLQFSYAMVRVRFKFFI